jgi:hypothetical protein
MSDFIPKPGAAKVGGLSRKAQKLQAMRDKAAQQNTGAKPQAGSSDQSFKAKDSFANTKKTSFQRKAV